MLLVLNGPMASGKSTLVKDLAKISKREVQQVFLMKPLPWDSNAIYHIDMDDITPEVFAWIEQQAVHVDIILETRTTLPRFDVKQYNLSAIPAYSTR